MLIAKHQYVAYVRKLGPKRKEAVFTIERTPTLELPHDSPGDLPAEPIYAEFIKVSRPKGEHHIYGQQMLREAGEIQKLNIAKGKAFSCVLQPHDLFCCRACDRATDLQVQPTDSHKE